MKVKARNSYSHMQSACLRFRLAGLLYFVLAASSCGGGTTGTSPIGERAFNGVVVEENGGPLSNEPMSVLAPDDTLLIASSTDEDGRFEMRLPESVKAFQVSLGKVPPVTLSPQLPAPSRLAARVVVSQDSQTSAARTLYEVKAENVEGCSAMVAAGDRIILTPTEDSSGCTVLFQLSSDRLEAQEFRGDFIARCNSRDELVGSNFEQGEPLLRVELDRSLPQDCEKLEIHVFNSADPALPLIFPVEMKNSTAAQDDLKK